ncbi:MAG: hypothetical protein WDM96_05110 [Lacunisphaera sp.]
MTVADAGSYTVAVTNVAGATASAPAILTVRSAAAGGDAEQSRPAL